MLFLIFGSILFLFLILLVLWYYYRVDSSMYNYSTSEISSTPSSDIQEDQSTPEPYDGREVYNLGSNIFTYVEAEAVCKAFDGELASYEEVSEAYKKGAEWCNYGWSKGQQALYPTQQNTFDRLQKGSPSQQHMCGNPGLNGGYFKENDIRFGANCFGKRPNERDIDRQYLIFEKKIGNSSESELHPTEEEISPFEKLVRKYRNEKDELIVLPFSSTQWKEPI